MDLGDRVLSCKSCGLVRSPFQQKRGKGKSFPVAAVAAASLLLDAFIDVMSVTTRTANQTYPAVGVTNG